MLTIIKEFNILFPLLEIVNILAIFKINQFQLSFQVYSLLGQTDGERKAFFKGCKKGGHIVRLPPGAPGCHKRWKSLFFCEIWNNPIPPLFFIRPLTNEHCKTWSSMINLWIDSRTNQKLRIPLLARQRSSNYLELSSKNVFGEYDAVTLTRLYLKVLHGMISQNS